MGISRREDIRLAVSLDVENGKLRVKELCSTRYSTFDPTPSLIPTDEDSVYYY